MYENQSLSRDKVHKILNKAGLEYGFETDRFSAGHTYRIARELEILVEKDGKINFYHEYYWSKFLSIYAEYERL